ncbi:hypothetical protein [Mucilaginibacter sp. UR6-11]|uniref:hypothetical protein n=1 Tax=Mucilaginibacter sp. UR6-11 TaxID=1435644 RepID=UPI001E346930|nr:hypothetical protein [Mucilaginibacter sp. UR6-11]MCC8425095.1 hypothetical protein [Mucilaginibacter sp. UR6-11]
MKKRIILICLFLLAPVIKLFAQLPPVPCDPDECPIDSWVILFALAVLTITILHLYNKQKISNKSSFD